MVKSNRVSSAAKNAVINYVGSRLLSEQAGINAVIIINATNKPKKNCPTALPILAKPLILFNSV